MSRGPGRRQRAILEAVEKRGSVGVTHPSETPSEQVAYRRAAYRLEEAGKIVLTAEYVAGRPRLVAHKPGTEVPDRIKTIGIDGKEYRRPF